MECVDYLPPPLPPDHRGSTPMVEGRFRALGGANAVCEQIDIEIFKFENVAAFSGKIIINLLYLVLVNSDF